MTHNLNNLPFWYLKKDIYKPLRNDLNCDVVVVGGGFAGLSAAYAFNQKGFKVALLEKFFCGSGASGKSSGFITPDSEFALRDLFNFYSKEESKKIWEFITSGVNFIRQMITSYNLECEYIPLDTVVLASTQKEFKTEIEKEYKARMDLGYPSKLYTKDELNLLLQTQSYFGAIAYGDTFAINGYLFCQEFKKILKDQGVSIYEETPVLNIESGRVYSTNAIISSDIVVLAVDRYLPNLNVLTDKVYQVQTYLLLSEPLSDSQVKAIFPQEPFMAWDTDLIFNYFRLTSHKRLLIGGSSLLDTYASKISYRNSRVQNKLLEFVRDKFPQINVTFKYFWPGMIGISKDILPISGRLKDYKNVYAITAATGLPWAAALGQYCAQSMVDGLTDLDHFFDPGRKFFVGPILQKFIGKKLSFAFSNFMRKS